jgi:excisionase family DNA binding protein
MFDITPNDDVASGRPVPSVVSPYLTAPEAAKYLRTTVQGIYSLVKRRRIHPMPGRPGRLLFTRPALDRFLSTRCR